MNHLAADELNKQNSSNCAFDQNILEQLCLLKKIFTQTKQPSSLTVYLSLMDFLPSPSKMALYCILAAVTHTSYPCLVISYTTHENPLLHNNILKIPLKNSSLNVLGRNC